MKTLLISILFAVVFVLSMVALSAIGGCAAAHPTAGPAIHPAITSTPTSLTGVSKGLDWIIILAVVGVGVGVGLFFFMPAAHNLSIPILGVAGGIEVAALVTRVSLWFVPWVAGVLGLLALGVFTYEVWRNRARIEAAWAPLNGGFQHLTGLDQTVQNLTSKIS